MCQVIQFPVRPVSKKKKKFTSDDFERLAEAIEDFEIYQTNYLTGNSSSWVADLTLERCLIIEDRSLFNFDPYDNSVKKIARELKLNELQEVIEKSAKITPSSYCDTEYLFSEMIGEISTQLPPEIAEELRSMSDEERENFADFIMQNSSVFMSGNDLVLHLEYDGWAIDINEERFIFEAERILAERGAK